MEIPKPAPDEFFTPENSKAEGEGPNITAPTQPVNPSQSLESKLTGWQQQSLRDFNGRRISKPNEPNKSTHAHHWRIEEPNGPISMGHCQDCGKEREFKNYPEGDADRNTLSELLNKGF